MQKNLDQLTKDHSPEIVNSFENNDTVIDTPDPGVTPPNIESENNESVSQSDTLDIYRGPIQQITDHYFMPKSFESKRLYESLGIRTFKKYIPTGDIAAKHFWSKVGLKSLMLNKDYNDRPRMLKTYEISTRAWETTHLGLLGWFATRDILDGDYSNVKSAIGSTALQVAVNVYPIMLQRYNRIRILPIINNSCKTTGESVSPVE